MIHQQQRTEKGQTMEREQIVIRAPQKLKEEIQRMANERGASVNETVLFLIRLGLERQ